MNRGEATDRIMRSSLPPAQKTVLMCYLSHQTSTEAPGAAVSWPGLPALAAYVGSRTNAQRHRSALLTSKILIRVGVDARGTLKCRIDFSALSMALHYAQSGQGAQSGHCAQKEHSRVPNLVNEPSVENLPYKNPHSPPAGDEDFSDDVPGDLPSPSAGCDAVAAGGSAGAPSPGDEPALDQPGLFSGTAGGESGGVSGADGATSRVDAVWSSINDLRADTGEDRWLVTPGRRKWLAARLEGFTDADALAVFGWYLSSPDAAWSRENWKDPVKTLLRPNNFIAYLERARKLERAPSGADTTGLVWTGESALERLQEALQRTDSMSVPGERSGWRLWRPDLRVEAAMLDTIQDIVGGSTHGMAWFAMRNLSSGFDIEQFYRKFRKGFPAHWQARQGERVAA